MKLAISLCIAGVIVGHILATFKCYFPFPKIHKVLSNLDTWNAMIFPTCEIVSNNLCF